jgi:hypothetical protein
LPADIVVKRAPENGNVVFSLGQRTTLTRLSLVSVGGGVYIDGDGAIVTELVITGTPTTGPGITVEVGLSQSNVVIGPGVAITGGTAGIHSSNSASAGFLTVTGTPTLPTSITNCQGIGINVPADVTTSVPGTRNVTITNCIIGVRNARNIDGLTVTGGPQSTLGILGGTIKNTLVSGLTGVGILSPVEILDTVEVRNILGHGVKVEAATITNINGLTSTMNQGDGIRCDSTSAIVKLRNSKLLANAGNGFMTLNNCGADLGSNGELGNNEFNRTSMKNGMAGLCLLGTYPLASVASGATFSCGHTGASCTTSVAPSSFTATTCQIGDITTVSGTSLTVPSPSCCN